MSKSRRLRLRDLKHIYRMIGECRDLGADPAAWRRHLLEGLCRMLDMSVAIAGESPGPQGFRFDKLEGVIDLGWPGEKERDHYRQFIAEGAIFSDPLILAMARLPPGNLVTRRREEMVLDRDWYRSAHFNEWHRESGLDAGMLSLRRLDYRGAPTIHGICLRRPVGEAPSTVRERRILHWTHHEIGPLIGRQLAASTEPSITVLSPRQQQTLKGLLQGDSEKQIARRLGISKSTVHKYVMRLHRHFDVQSRGELLAHWARFDGNPNELLENTRHLIPPDVNVNARGRRPG